MSRVFDCFPFFNELDLLEIRLNELSPVVHRFVLAEATRTHKGDPKPLHFAENRARFAPFLDRIVHIVVDDLPLGGETEKDHFRRENYQRNALARGLGEAKGDDFILVSDLDEIPRPETIRAIVSSAGMRPAMHFIELRWYYYFLNYEREQRWINGPRMTRMRHLTTPQALRNLHFRRRPPIGRLRRIDWVRRRYGRLMDAPYHQDAGWHFSYLSDVAGIAAKLRDYAHNHPAAQMEASHIARSIAAGRSYNPRDPVPIALKPLDRSFPAYVRENKERFAPLIADEMRLQEFGRVAEDRGREMEQAERS
jgi:beta-1,4-mannosyl-glycoprotein beta-1,4-N-acetylglucosaminyltransferase